MKGVNAIIIEKENIFAIKRNKEPFKGMYGFPGGSIEKNENQIAALKRELKEETGFEIEVQESDYVGKDSIEYKGTIFEIFFYRAKIIGRKELLQKEEVQEIKWMTESEFLENLKKNNFPNEKITVIQKLFLKSVD